MIGWFTLWTEWDSSQLTCQTWFGVYHWATVYVSPIFFIKAIAYLYFLFTSLLFIFLIVIHQHLFGEHHFDLIISLPTSFTADSTSCQSSCQKQPARNSSCISMLRVWGVCYMQTLSYESRSLFLYQQALCGILDLQLSGHMCIHFHCYYPFELAFR